MDDEKNNDNFEKVKKFVKDHQVEIIYTGVGMLAGILLTRHIYERNLTYTTKLINDNLTDVFTQHRGNFQLPDGTFPIPQLIKK
jgi:predicted DNA-binding protein with PD1-like motif